MDLGQVGRVLLARFSFKTVGLIIDANEYFDDTIIYRLGMENTPVDKQISIRLIG